MWDKGSSDAVGLQCISSLWEEAAVSLRSCILRKFSFA